MVIYSACFYCFIPKQTHANRLITLIKDWTNLRYFEVIEVGTTQFHHNFHI